MKLHVYLNFQGKAEEAVLFYAKAFGGQTPKLLKYGQVPPNPNFTIPEEAKDFVMHTEIEIGEQTIKMSDVLPGTPFEEGTNQQVAVEFTTEAEFDAVYEVLNDNIVTIVPVAPAFFASKYTYFVDKFGTPWHLMVQKQH